MYNELIDALRNHRVCDDDKCKTCELMDDAADAIERLQSDIAKKDSQLTEWKNAWRIASSLYKSAQTEIDELRAYEHELVDRIEMLKAELSELKQKEQTKQEGDTNQ